jgi:hypothetical protein
MHLLGCPLLGEGRYLGLAAAAAGTSDGAGLFDAYKVTVTRWERATGKVTRQSLVPGPARTPGLPFRVLYHSSALAPDGKTAVVPGGP